MQPTVLKYKDLSVDQILKDLAWIMQGADLLSKPARGLNYRFLTNDFWNDFEVINQHNPKIRKELSTFFNSDQQFILGKYFEKLLAWLFNKSTRYEVILSGYQLHEKQTTLGEIDFLLFDLIRQDYVHLEVAVKYYLGHNNTSDPASWIGPNGQDNLGKKLQKFSHQLALSDRLSNVLMPDIPIKKAVLLRGYFFKGMDAESWPENARVSFNNHNSWMYHHQLGAIDHAHYRYFLRPKHSWLALAQPLNTKEITEDDFENVITNELERIGKGILITGVPKNQTHPQRNIMIVPDQWPELVK